MKRIEWLPPEASGRPIPDIEAFRAPLYDNRMPSGFAAMFFIALLTLAVGWLLFTRSADDIPYRA